MVFIKYEITESGLASTRQSLQMHQAISPGVCRSRSSPDSIHFEFEQNAKAKKIPRLLMAEGFS
jgi:hypothetical protein